MAVNVMSAADCIAASRLADATWIAFPPPLAGNSRRHDCSDHPTTLIAGVRAAALIASHARQSTPRSLNARRWLLLPRCSVLVELEQPLQNLVVGEVRRRRRLLTSTPKSARRSPPVETGLARLDTTMGSVQNNLRAAEGKVDGIDSSSA